MPIIQETIITREESLFFLNSRQVPGVTSLRYDFNVNDQGQGYLGNKVPINFPRGAQVGNISIATQMVSDDYFISQTGDARASFYLLKSQGDFTNNFVAETAYQTSYSSRYNLGQQPTIDVGYQVFGNMGRILTSDLSFLNFLELISISSTHPTGLLQNFHVGCVETNIDYLGINRLQSYEILINTPRFPVYTLGSRTPARVLQAQPVEININLQFEVANFDHRELNDYPVNEDRRTITIDVKNTDNVVVKSYSFENMILNNQSYEIEASDVAKTSLSYKQVRL